MSDGKTEWISTQEAAELVGVDPVTVWRWAKRGDVEARQIGRSWIIDKADVIRHKAQRDKQAKGRGR